MTDSTSPFDATKLRRKPLDINVVQSVLKTGFTEFYNVLKCFSDLIEVHDSVL